MRHLLSLACVLAVSAGCIEAQDHGARTDAGGFGDDAGGSSDDAAVATDATSVADAGARDSSDRDSAVATALPPFLEISFVSSAYADVVLAGDALTPRVVPIQRIRVTAAESEGSVTHHPSGALGPCDLYPPVGTSTWPPGTRVPASTIPLAPEHVAITADGARIDVEAEGDAVVATANLEPGARFALTVTIPGHAPIRRDVVLEPPLRLSSPANAPTVSSVMEGDHTPGTDLTLTWPIEHVDTPNHAIDLGGSRAAARCNVAYEDGSLTLTAAELDALIDPTDPSMFVQMWSTGASDTTVGTTRVRVTRAFLMPSLLLRLR